MNIKGKAHKFGNDINTDDIIAASCLNTTDPKQLGSHCMETIAPDFVKNVSSSDIIAAGKNFGCGSSREHAPIAIKGCGVSLVIAENFARIFFRNAINIGLPILELKEAGKINQGDVLEVDLAKGLVKNITQNSIYQAQPFAEFMQELIAAGGLMQWVKVSGKDKRCIRLQ